MTLYPHSVKLRSDLLHREVAVDFKYFRERAKESGLAVDQHEYKDSKWIFMTRYGVLCVPADYGTLGRLLAFAEEKHFNLLEEIEELHASRLQIESHADLVVWQPYEPPRSEHRPLSGYTRHGGAPERSLPKGRIFFKDWLAGFDVQPTMDD